MSFGRDLEGDLTKLVSFGKKSSISSYDTGAIQAIGNLALTLLEKSLTLFVLHDVRQPELRLLNQHNQFGLVNPDNRYHIANITTPGTYTLRGRRGTSADLQIQVGAGDPGFTDETNLAPVDLLSLDDLEVEDDDTFEITISDTDPGGNGLCNTNGDLTARYQGAQVGDLWFNGLDFCHRQTSLTLSQARPSSDGLFRLVLSAKDPGVANWLDPAGASTAFVYVRWQGLQQGCTLAPSNFPRAREVDFDKIREHLPDDEPDFSAEERVEQLAARQASGLRSPRAF